jgi:hypothetical protein
MPHPGQEPSSSLVRQEYGVRQSLLGNPFPGQDCVRRQSHETFREHQQWVVPAFHTNAVGCTQGIATDEPTSTVVNNRAINECSYAPSANGDEVFWIINKALQEEVGVRELPGLIVDDLISKVDGVEHAPACPPRVAVRQGDEWP